MFSDRIVLLVSELPAGLAAPPIVRGPALTWSDDFEGDKYRGNYQDWPIVGEYDVMEVRTDQDEDGVHADRCSLNSEREWYQQRIGRLQLRHWTRRPL
jgi:hypothetical protein